MTFEHLVAFGGVIATIIGATWTLRAALDDVRAAVADVAGALRTHVATDDLRHEDQDSKITAVIVRVERLETGAMRLAK